MSKSVIIYFVLMMFLAIVFSTVDGEEIYSKEDETMLDMSLEELLDVPVIVSASRHEQGIYESTIPVSVISSKDIHYSGLMDLPNILQFRPGVDILPCRRGIYPTGVRGMHDIISERSLILIDGKPFNSPYYGGVEFFIYPLIMEDIERVEVLRGPGGAAWGANALNGVINVITKDTADTKGLFIGSTFTEFNDIETYLRYGFGNNKFSSRISVLWQEVVDSEQAGAGELSYRNSTLESFLGSMDFGATDNIRKYIIDWKNSYNVNEDTVLDFGVDYTDFSTGNIEYVGIYSKDDYTTDSLFTYLKLSHDFDEDSSGYLQGRYNYYDIHSMATVNYIAREYDIEGQCNFKIAEKHHVQVGTNLHLTALRFDFPSPTQVQYDEKRANEYQLGAFIMDRWDYSPEWSFEGQLRGDWFSENDNEVATRVTAMRHLNTEKSKSLRFSVGRAFRVPTYFLRNSKQVSIQVAPGMYATNFLKPDGLENEVIWSYEAGFQQMFADNTLLFVNGYYQELDNMIGLEFVPDPLNLGRRMSRVYNQDKIQGYGAELEIEKRMENSNLGFWFAYNDLRDKYSEQNFRSYAPAKHKFGVNWRYYIDENWTFNLNYRFSDITRSFFDVEDISSSNRLDVTLSRKIFSNNGELLIGVSDVFNKDHDPVFGFGHYTSVTTPGRMLFGRLQLKF